MSFLSNILALLPDNISKRIKPVDLRTSFEYVYADLAKLQLDQVLTLGTITATTTTLALDLHSSGVNSVLMSGVERSKTEGDDFTFAPVSGGKLKYVLLYALPDPQLFHIIEGVEGNEAIYPDLPPGALLIKAVLISEFGALLEDADGGYKPLAEDPWRNIVINSNAAVNIIMASSPSASFNVLVGTGVTAPKIAAIKTKVKKNTRDGQEITFYNDSDVPVALLAGDYEETLVYTTFPFADNYEIKPRSFAKFKRKENTYHELAGGGSASFPETGSNGDVLEKDSAEEGGVKWSNRLTTAENEIDAEVVNRALADALKLDKPPAPNNVATKVILGDGSTKNISDFSQVEQIEVGASGNAQEAWKGKLVLLTASCTITIPTGLSNNWSCEIATLAGVTLTWAITSPKTWLFGTPPTFPEKSMCTISQRGTTNDIMLFGGYGI